MPYDDEIEVEIDLEVEIVFTCPDCQTETVVEVGVVVCKCGYLLPVIEVEIS